jgi:hypothetical protein
LIIIEIIDLLILMNDKDWLFSEYEIVPSGVEPLSRDPESHMIATTPRDLKKLVVQFCI